MTAGTGGDGVGALKRKISAFMVEGFPVQSDDIRCASFMVGMAAFALAICDTLDAAMKTALLLDIRGDFFVAVQAQATLFQFAELGMALAAVGLIFGVPLDQFTRHHECFNAAVGCSCG